MGASADKREARPVGMLRPSHDRAALALKAIDESRWKDARKHIEALSEVEPGLASWRALLEGELHFHHADMVKAADCFQRAASLALSHGAAGLTEATGTVANHEAMRLAGEAMEQLGKAKLRQEAIAQAARAHHLALVLRQEHGSVMEEWQSTMSLAVDLSLAGEHDRALATLSRATVLAVTLAGSRLVQPGPDAAKLNGIYVETLERTARALAAAGRLGECVETWRTALEVYSREFASTLGYPQARMQLGRALLKHAEALIDDDPGAAEKALGEAVMQLREAAESLGAFGCRVAAETRECSRLLDFAERLQASID